MIAAKVKEQPMNTNEWFDQFRPMSFRIFLSKDENYERHLNHECGHVWIGIEHNAQLVKFNLNPDQDSEVLMTGIGSMEVYYEIGVAGLLAEAKAIIPAIRRSPRIDIGQMRALAEWIHDEIFDHREDDKYGIRVDVPFETRSPSTMWGGLSVKDIWKPLHEAWDVSRLADTLTSVATRFNSAANWGRFTDFVDQQRR
jgi:hypothetical protein